MNSAFDIKTNSFEIKDSTALVTGATSGIGLATSLQLASHGCHLRLVARREERLIELKKHCAEKYKINVEFIVGDVTHEKTIQEMRDQKFFESPILINNAGAAFGRAEVKDFTISDMEKTIQLNVIAAFRIIREALPYMIQKGMGDIVSLSSVAGLDPYAGGATYCASKAALKTFHQALLKEIYGQNIRVMMISPGMVETEFALVRWNQDQEKAKATYQGMSPLTPHDVARQILHMLTNPRHASIHELVFLTTDQGGAALVKRK